jgi:hypothetical protein
MNVLSIYSRLPVDGQRMVEKVLVDDLGSMAAAVARECKSPDGELHLNLLRDMASCASLYATILRRARSCS